MHTNNDQLMHSEIHWVTTVNIYCIKHIKQLHDIIASNIDNTNSKSISTLVFW